MKAVELSLLWIFQVCGTSFDLLHSRRNNHYLLVLLELMGNNLTSRLKTVSYIAVSVGALCTLIWLVWKVPEIHARRIADPVEQARAEMYARDVYIKGIGGLAVIVTAIISWRNLKSTQKGVLVAEEKQVTERFAKAVEMLSDENSPHIRLGGIYALERIAKDSEKDHWQVMEILSAFIRSKLGKSSSITDMVENQGEPYITATLQEFKDWEIDALHDEWDREQNQRYEYDIGDMLAGEINPRYRRTPSEDIQAAITAIGRRKIWNKSADYVINLRNLELDSFHISGNFSDVDFSGSYFICTTFEGSPSNPTSFDRANFVNAQFIRVEAIGCSAQKAVFRNTIIGFSRLHRSNFIDADFTGSLMDAVDVNNCNFTKSVFSTVEIGQRIKRLVKDKMGGESWESIWLQGDNQVLKSSFRDADFSKSLLSRILLEDVDFRSASFIEASTSHNRGGDRSTKFHGCSFVGASFEDASLGHSVFKDSDLSDVSLTRTKLRDADFRGALGLTTQQVASAKTAKHWEPKFDENITKGLKDKNSIDST